MLEERKEKRQLSAVTFNYPTFVFRLGEAQIPSGEESRDAPGREEQKNSEIFVPDKYYFSVFLLLREHRDACLVL